jgi:predicted ribosome quality control (RQC) complex YloA/Tae2 family protein
MENLALIALAEQLKPALDGFLIRRVVQHQPHGFLFHGRSSKLPALKILMNAPFPALYVSEAKAPVETETSDFLMVLRKHLTSAELVDFRKPLSERIFEFEFKTVVPSKELARMTLVIEVIPNAANIILLDMERRILASFYPISPQHSIGEFEAYAIPAPGDKISVERVLAEENLDLTESNTAKKLVERVAGLGPVVAAEVLFRQKHSGRPLAEEIRALLSQTSSSSAAWIYSELPLVHITEQNDLRLLEKAIVSPVDLQSLERTHSKRSFNTVMDAARFYFDEMESRTLLERAKLPLLRELRVASKRMAERERKLMQEQRKYGDAESIHKTAQMLTSSGMKMDQRYEKAEVTDYFGDAPTALQIALDPAMTLRENIDRMFKLHHKAARGRTIVQRQLDELRNKKELVNDQIRRLTAIRDWDTWLAVSGRIQKQRQPTVPASSSVEPVRSGYRSIMVDGREILVGRSSRDNDELTFRTAAPDDFWLHAGDYSGSHVVIRNPSREKEPPENVLTKAAQLAAYFSRARNASRVEVHYTHRKHVSKPRKAKPGLVRLAEFKSIAVEPRNWLEE